MDLELDLDRLRPIERRIIELARNGVAEVEIAQRFRRTPGYVRRVLALAEIPRRELERAIDELRPIERLVLNWVQRGGRPADLAARLRRTPGYVVQVERLARRRLIGLSGGVNHAMASGAGSVESAADAGATHSDDA
jgi:hypothetical protein